jgi:hypothetical protein
MPHAYAVEVVGKLARRDAEALALELCELARRYRLTVAQFAVEPVAREGGGLSQSPALGLGPREPQRHFHLGEQRHGAGEAIRRVGTTEEA